ncbi:MAG: HEAT repeat domain-containing protein [Melioribacteraceae bacterium]|nr:HEAT repeat domain-containing protein [Melioribacteraceae bacterium]
MEEQKTKSTFFMEVKETYLMLLKNFGWLAYVYMGYMVYNLSETKTDFNFFEDGLLLIALGTLGVIIVGYILAFILTPLIGIDKRRIQDYEQANKISHLLGMIHTPSTSKLWRMACDAVVRLGAQHIPILLQALAKETCPVKNPLGIKISSTASLRAGAAYCLGKLNVQSAVPQLILALDDNETDVRMIASQALGEIGDKSALPRIKEISETDKNADVISFAQEALKKLSS